MHPTHPMHVNVPTRREKAAHVMKALTMIPSSSVGSGSYLSWQQAERKQPRQVCSLSQVESFSKANLT